MNNPVPVGEIVDDEITVLVARLVETHWRLEQLAGGQVDAVLLPDGHSHLLRKAQETLRQSETDLRDAAAIQSSILNALPANIALLDEDGTILSVNESWRNFARNRGLTDPTAGVGTNYLGLCETAEGAWSENAKEVAAGIRAVITGEADAFLLDYPCPGPAEPRCWFRMRVSPLRAGGPSGAVVMHADITASQMAKLELREREAEFRTLAEAVPQIVWITKPDGWNIYFNERWVEYTGLTREESLGHGSFMAFNPDDQAQVRDCWYEAVATLGTYSLEARLRRADGVYRWWLIRGVPHLDERGVLSKWFGTCTDIHDLKMATEALQEALDDTERQVATRTAELASTNAKLTVALKRADSANLAKSQFLSRMSHELRTPMNAVLGYSQLLLRRYQDPEILEFAGAIHSGGKHLLKLIDEVLDIGRVESGELSVSLEPVEYDEVLAEVMKIIKPIASAAGVDVTIHSPANAWVLLKADRQRLIQVLINLLGNAIKYNRKRGRVDVTCICGDGATGRIEVSDTGYGISPSDQALLFQPFQRFGDLGIEGTGLGLALSQRLMGLMGGRLGLAESSDRGSTFFVELATARAPSIPGRSAAGAEAGVRDDDNGPILRGEILCVEDNAANMRLMEFVVARWNQVSLTPATNGTIALELARSRIPDLILLDLHLPDMSGATVLKQLKHDPETAAIPVVILSADATSEQIKSLLAGGAVAYLAKPIDLSRFAEVIGPFLTTPSLRTI